MVREGQKVKVHYTGRFPDGEVFDTSTDKEPLEFIVGSKNIIKGFSKAVETMEVGQKAEFTIPPEDAYGFYDEDKIVVMPMASIPNAAEFKIGETMHLLRDGMIATTKLLKVENGEGYFDFNMPLADKTLVFEIELLEAEDE